MPRQPRSIREAAMNYLSRREHTRQELLHKLLDKDYPQDEVEQALDRLEDQGLLSESRFAEAFVRQRQLRGSGPLKIRAELRQKGLNENLLDQFLDVHDPLWNEVAQQVWQKKYGEKARDWQEKARQQRFLQSRGFTSEQIGHVLQQDD